MAKIQTSSGLGARRRHEREGRGRERPNLPQAGSERQEYLPGTVKVSCTTFLSIRASLPGDLCLGCAPEGRSHFPPRSARKLSLGASTNSGAVQLAKVGVSWEDRHYP